MERKTFVIDPEYKTGGSEGEIFTVKEGLFKKYKMTVFPSVRKRKEELLLFLDKIEALKKYYPEIRYIIDSFIFPWIQGYIMQPIIGVSADSGIFSVDEKLMILSKLKKIIEEFRNHGLYYYDIRRPNIKVCTNLTPILLDIDGLIRDGEKIDALPYYISDYIKRGGKLDEHAQILMFNRFTEQCFSYNEICRDFNYDKTMYEILDDKKRCDSIYDNEYLCDYMSGRRR